MKIKTWQERQQDDLDKSASYYMELEIKDLRTEIKNLRFELEHTRFSLQYDLDLANRELDKLKR